MVVRPDNTSFTCIQGKGILSTFFIISEALAPLVKACESFEVPWGTHLGVRLRLSTSLAETRYTAWRRPLRFKSYGAKASEATWRLEKEEAARALSASGGIRGMKLRGDSALDAWLDGGSRARGWPNGLGPSSRYLSTTTTWTTRWRRSGIGAERLCPS